MQQCLTFDCVFMNVCWCVSAWIMQQCLTCVCVFLDVGLCLLCAWLMQQCLACECVLVNVCWCMPIVNAAVLDLYIQMCICEYVCGCMSVLFWCVQQLMYACVILVRAAALDLCKCKLCICVL
jgi:hypothetical protein